MYTTCMKIYVELLSSLIPLMIYYEIKMQNIQKIIIIEILNNVCQTLRCTQTSPVCPTFLNESQGK